MSARIRPATFAVLVALLAAATAGGISPASAAPINACAKKKTGALRLLAKGKKCRKGERKLSWSANGPAGATGAPGAAGTQGAAGAKGDTGAQGTPGGDGSFVGTLAGGDLTGSYPNPQILGNAIGGPEVANDALTGADIDESTLAKVPNADLLDGFDSTEFLLATGKAADSDLLDGLNSTAFLAAAGKAADSDLLDGLDSAGFLRRLASGSATLDLPSILSLGCTSQSLGSAPSVHGAYVLVNNAYDQASLLAAGPPTLLDVSALRIPNGTADDIFVKVCNLNPLSAHNPASATFDWVLIG